MEFSSPYRGKEVTGKRNGLIVGNLDAGILTAAWDIYLIAA
jgi:hypothetical protein